jgi:hypothetical protein
MLDTTTTVTGDSTQPTNAPADFILVYNNDEMCMVSICVQTYTHVNNTYNHNFITMYIICRRKLGLYCQDIDISAQQITRVNK